jgi:hypothetical protein
MKVKTITENSALFIASRRIKARGLVGRFLMRFRRKPKPEFIQPRLSK